LAEGLKRQYTECAATSVADALRTRKEKVVSDALLAALDDFEPTWLTARAHVLSALGGRNDPRITAVLLDNLQNAEDEGMKEACARALSLEGDDAVTEALVKTLQTADEFLLRDGAALSLGIRGEARQGQQRNAIASALKKALSTEKNDRVKKDIAKALAQIEKAK
jgi:HEAT repeat protein